MTTPTVLVVDDNPMLRVLLSTVLRRDGFRVLLAEDGQAAVELFVGDESCRHLVRLSGTRGRSIERVVPRRLHVRSRCGGPAFDASRPGIFSPLRFEGLNRRCPRRSPSTYANRVV